MGGPTACEQSSELANLLLELNPARIQRIQRRLRLLHLAVAVRQPLPVAGNLRIFKPGACGRERSLRFGNAAFDSREFAAV